jgi:hypothetical protein
MSVSFSTVAANREALEKMPLGKHHGQQPV